MRNIKRIISIGLAICSVFSLSSCLNRNENDKDSQIYSENDISKTAEDLYGYKNIECKTSKNIETIYFSFKNSNEKVIYISLPTEWSLKESSNGYDIIRDSVKIGTLKSEKVSLGADEKSCESETVVSNNVKSSWDLIYSGGNFIHRVVYTCTLGGVERAITLEVGYSELDDFGLKKVKYSTGVKNTRTESQSGTIDLSTRAGQKPILILGNSFVGTSQVGLIFEQMCKASTKNNYNVKWDSIGGATVSRNWSEYHTRIRNGEYAAVFMCGFYGYDDVLAFQKFVDLCEASDTPIVIFPAHNEGKGSEAAEKYPDVYYLDWKAEINAIIDSGVSKRDFCDDDSLKHSTPLAGYVGAHMIYRALFDEIPPILDKYYDIPHHTVVEKLGDYPQTGSLDLTDNWIIYDIK